MSYYLYIIECSDGSLYTGWTNNLSKRMEAHNSGKGAKYTRSRRPVLLKYVKKCQGLSEALKMECRIKKLNRGQKEALLRGEGVF